MKCYYEELGISREAEDAEIKSAYRKLALRWHPDKNLDRLEEAKEKFQIIQQAYEVLSDPQERAFYDKHRDQILRGKNSNYEDHTLDVFPYFTKCYIGFGDDDKGFYAVYREVFNKIAAEDAEFMDDDDELDEIPSFGNSQSSYEEVVGPFYAYWQSYCTKKTYTWLCPYDIQEIKDRRILRAIEKETKKIVQNAKKERNEEIRSLVAFVRKRDKRVQAYNRLLEERAAANREKAKKNRQEQLLRRQRELEEMKKNSNQVNNDGYEEQLKQLEQHYGEDSDEYVTESDENAENEEEENYIEEFFCVACSKAFKNQRNFENHTSSKKHRENEEILKQEMLEEEESFGKLSINDEVSNNVSNETSANEEERDIVVDLDNKHEDEDIDSEIDLSNEHEIENGATSTKSSKNKKGKKSKKNLSKFIQETEEDSDHDKFLLKSENEISDTEDWGNTSKKGNRKQQKKKQEKKKTEEKTLDKSIKEEKPLENLTKMQSSIENTFEANNATGPTTHLCATCQATFDSKNKLFAHLKKTNHSVYLPKAQTQAERKIEAVPKKGKGKRK